MEQRNFLTEEERLTLPLGKQWKLQVEREREYNKLLVLRQGNKGFSEITEALLYQMVEDASTATIDSFVRRITDFARNRLKTQFWEIDGYFTANVAGSFDYGYRVELTPLGMHFKIYLEAGNELGRERVSYITRDIFDTYVMHKVSNYRCKIKPGSFEYMLSC